MKSTISALLFGLALGWGSFVAAAEASEYLFTVTELEQAIAERLVEEGAGDEVMVTITSLQDKVLHQSDKPLFLSVDYIEFNTRNARFEATVSLLEEDTHLRSETVIGRFEPVIELPVLVNRLHSGEIIREEDVAYARFAESRLRRNVIFQPNKLIGMAARRVIAPNRPIASHEVEAPILVEKGDLVTINYRTPFMEISSMAKAIQDGALGDVISFKNADSGVVIRAEVVAAGMAEIQDNAAMILSRR